jgi:hypothetical protein
VLIPGFMADARSFMPQIAVLGASRPIILLTPGLGDSIEKIVAEAGPMLPPRFALLGHGLGGNVAIEILRATRGGQPDRPDRDRPPARTPSLAAEQEALSGRGQDRPSGRLHRPDASATALHDAPWRDEVLALVQDMAATLGSTSSSDSCA